MKTLIIKLYLVVACQMCEPNYFEYKVYDIHNKANVGVIHSTTYYNVGDTIQIKKQLPDVKLNTH